MPDPALAPIRLIAPSTEESTWWVTIDGALVNSGTSESAEAASIAADLVAVSVVSALRTLGIAARVEPTI